MMSSNLDLINLLVSIKYFMYAPTNKRDVKKREGKKAANLRYVSFFYLTISKSIVLVGCQSFDW
jgi:hypothetical protein